MSDVDCVSCGLPLPAGVSRCPGCGQHQVVQLANTDDARCAVHVELAAVGACARCGRFMCVECNAVDAGVCRSCLEVVQRDVRARLDSLNVKAGLVAAVQGVLAPALSWWSHDRALFGLLAAFGAVSLVFGLVSLATRGLWIAGAIACGMLGLLSCFAISSAPALGICIGLAVVEWRYLSRSGPLEREAWLLKK